MNMARITPSELIGTVTIPASKSAAHRAFICSFLSGGGKVNELEESEDIKATKGALKALSDGSEVIDCNESGSTLRFMIPVAAALGKTVTFIGTGKLPIRPIDEYLRLLPAHGVKCEYSGTLPLTISGKLTPGKYALAGNVSSQYITGLLLALPILDGDSELILTTELQSKPYVDMTVKVMQDFGVTVKETKTGYFVRGNQCYKQREYTVEGDWSQAAFFLAGGALTGDVTLLGLDPDSAQGDKEIAAVLRRFGADIQVEKNAVRVKKSHLHGINIDVADIPDTVPALAVIASYASGKTVITGGERLRIKESDRIESVVTNLQKAGINAVETADGMIIEGGAPAGACLDGYNDHRIVMAMSVLALAASGTTQISDASSINKSYPTFFNDYNSLGGKADVICDRG